MWMDNSYHLAHVFCSDVVLRIELELFVQLRGDVPAREVLLRPPNSQQQAATLFRVLRRRVRLHGRNDVFSHDQHRAMRETAGNPPKESSSFSPKRNLQHDRQPLHWSRAVSYVGLMELKLINP